jgi:hypothetical protein
VQVWDIEVGAGASRFSLGNEATWGDIEDQIRVVGVYIERGLTLILPVAIYGSMRTGMTLLFSITMHHFVGMTSWNRS